MFTQHAKRPSIGTSAVGSGSGSGRRKSSSLPPSPWSPTTRYSPFAEADEDGGASDVSSTSTVTQLEQHHDNNNTSTSAKPNQASPADSQAKSRRAPLFDTWVRRVSKLGVPGVRGWKGYVPVGDEQRDGGGVVDEDEDDVGYGAMGASRRHTKRPWWCSVAAALTAANALLFVASLLVWGHANGVAPRGARYGGEDARAPTGFDKEPNAPPRSPLRHAGDGLVSIANTHQANLPWAQPSKHAPKTHKAYGFGVFHQLHCLDYLRQAFYPGAMVDASKHEDQDPVMHRDHYVDYLRQAIMCNADVTFEPLLVPHGQIDGVGVRHLCRNWERGFAWAFAHRLV